MSVALGGGWSSYTLAVGDQPVKVKTGDINEDGYIDAVVANLGDGTISVLLANGLDGYLPQVALQVGDSPSSLTIVDFDNDGDLDIALVASNDVGERVVQVLRSDLNLTDFEDLIFASAFELAGGENPAMVDHGDMDGDGLADLVSVSEASSFRGSDPMAIISTRGGQCETPCNCLGDLNGDSTVGVEDLLEVIGAWGECVGCSADLDGDGHVQVNDLLILIAAWGPCK
jgi:hypothetical protein